MIAATIAEAITSKHAAPAQRLFARDLMLELLARPFSAAESADKLGISKPTALKWLRAGLLRRADGTSERANLFDAASVLSTRKVLQSLKMSGTVAQRARVVAELPERLYWDRNPQALKGLMRSLQQAAAGKLSDVTDEELARGREVLARRRVPVRRTSRPNRRKAPARVS